MDVWQYIHAEAIPIVPLYFAKEREMLVRGESLISVEQPFIPRLSGERPKWVKCRMRSLGCSPCTGAIHSDADTVPKIIAGADLGPALGARRTGSSITTGRLHGNEETGGLFLDGGCDSSRFGVVV